MARTIYFPDGSFETLFHDEHDAAANIRALERIIAERLGRDAEMLLRQIIQDLKEQGGNQL